MTDGTGAPGPYTQTPYKLVTSDIESVRQVAGSRRQVGSKFESNGWAVQTKAPEDLRCGETFDKVLQLQLAASCRFLDTVNLQ